MGRYSRGRRGGPAKAVGRATGARVQIPLFPPKVNYTHPTYFDGCVFFMWEYFGICFKYDKLKIWGMNKNE